MNIRLLSILFVFFTFSGLKCSVPESILDDAFSKAYEVSEENYELTDSLCRFILENTSSRLLTMRTYSILSESNYYFGNLDSARMFSIRSIALTDTNSLVDLKTYGIQLNIYASILSELGETDESINTYYQALKVFKKLDNEYGVSYVLTNLALTYNSLEKYEKALEIFKELEAFFYKNGIAEKGEYLNGYGNVYYYQKDFKNAESMYNKALDYYINCNDPSGISDSYSNLANIALNNGDYEKALELYKKCYSYDLESENTKNLSYTMNNIGILFSKLGEYEKSNIYLKKSCELDSLHGFIKGFLQAKINIAINYNYLNYFDRAKELLDGIENNPMLETFPQILEKFLLTKTTTVFSIGDKDNGFEALNKLIFLKDSINSTKRDSVISKFLADYEVDKLKKENELNSLQISKNNLEIENANIRQLVAVGLILVVIFAMILVLRKNKELEKERKKTDFLIESILPKSIIDEVKEELDFSPRKYIGITVLFIDFENFTEKTELIPIEKLLDELNLIYSKFDDIISDFGCERIKTAGDSYIAVSSLTNEKGIFAKKIVMAALSMIEFLEDRKKEYLLNWDVRIGIDTGNVISGKVGSKRIMFDIFGDPVNTASRMQQICEPMNVNITSRTRIFLSENDFKFVYRGSEPIKGKDKIEMFYVKKK
ncbi:MAG: tetratricopeptide repeat protein [Candidatus Delongbacteria bacterium]|nr:tetratricopeptide repeat protein [Candidatus Delongbacteria bacterium]